MNQLKNFCFKAFHFLAIKKEERVVAYTILLLILFLNGLLVWHYHDTLTLFSDDYHKMFRNGFNVSGFDAWTYTVISKYRDFHVVGNAIQYLPTSVVGGVHVYSIPHQPIVDAMDRSELRYLHRGLYAGILWFLLIRLLLPYRSRRFGGKQG